MREIELPFAVVTGRVVHDIIHADLPTCKQVVEDAYCVWARGSAGGPRSQFLRFPNRPDARIISLAAYTQEPRAVSGLKWIASYPSNIQDGLPRASAVVILNDFDTGYPFACLEGSIISATRTAALATLALERFVDKKDAISLAFVGTGLIAKYLYWSLMAGEWNIAALNLFDKEEDYALAFSGLSQGKHDRDVRVHESLDRAVQSSDVIVFTTTSGSPHVREPSLFVHNPVVLHLSLRDLAPSLIARSQNVVDSVEDVFTAGTSLELAESAYGDRHFLVGTLFDVMESRATIQHDRPIVFSPFGLAVLDIALAAHVFHVAKREGQLTHINDFFFETTRFPPSAPPSQ